MVVLDRPWQFWSLFAALWLFLVAYCPPWQVFGRLMPPHGRYSSLTEQSDAATLTPRLTVVWGQNKHVAIIPLSNQEMDNDVYKAVMPSPDKLIPTSHQRDDIMNEYFTKQFIFYTVFPTSRLPLPLHIDCDQGWERYWRNSF